MKQKHYIAGLYFRLSQEDERQGESVSIDNQRSMLRKYAEEHGFEIHDEYIDDGVSGTTFDRPDVQRLLDDAKAGIINTIIVKDLSRFGRNYIEVGQYVDYVFPAFGIRFIAIQDNVDTENRDSNAMEMMPIMNVFNEWHAANTSKKIRAVKKAHAKEGIYTAKKAAYGYKIGMDKKRTPVIDEETAPVVRRIFEMYASGISPIKIAETLNLEGVMSPATYAYSQIGQKPKPNVMGLWTATTIREMLNRSYTSGIWHSCAGRHCPTKIINDSEGMRVSGRSFTIPMSLLSRRSFGTDVRNGKSRWRKVEERKSVIRIRCLVFSSAPIAGIK